MVFDNAKDFWESHVIAKRAWKQDLGGGFKYTNPKSLMDGIMVYLYPIQIKIQQQKYLDVSSAHNFIQLL